MNQNPYAAPQSSGAGSEPEEPGASRYSGFWQRVGAYLIDFLVAVPMVALDYLVGGSTNLYPLYVFIPGVCFGLFIHVFMVYRYGGSPGKLVLGLRVAMLDGSRVTLQAVMLRYAVLFLIAVSTALTTVMVAMQVPNEIYTTLGYLQRGQELVANAPGWFKGLTALTQIWMLAGLIAIIANRKRRAVHDFICRDGRPAQVVQMNFNQQRTTNEKTPHCSTAVRVRFRLGQFGVRQTEKRF